MDPVIQKIRSFRWNYADSDPDARLEVEHRLIATARQRDLIPYSQLVNGEGVLILVEN